MEKIVVIGKMYAVTSSADCTVTDANGLTLASASAGQQAFFVATTDRITLSDSSAVITATFNLAPAKLRLLGLLGGGNRELPAGYLAAEFLESTGTQGIKTGMSIQGLEVETKFLMAPYTANSALMAYWDGKGYQFKTEKANSFFCQIVNTGKTVSCSDGVVHDLKVSADGLVQLDQTAFTLTAPSYPSVLGGISLFCQLTYYSASNVHFQNGFRGRVYFWNASNADGKKAEYVPCVDPLGKPSMFDRVTKQTFENFNTGVFIVGMTMEQARKLGKLPTGTTLTVSLPVGYDSDAGVVDALVAAETNGCVLTIQTYEAEASAVSTFALRRIWVRRQQDEHGTYVDAVCTRWQVEWCVTIIGADPETLGYEPFRSVEAAVAYWELEPWVDPAWEEELLTEGE